MQKIMYRCKTSLVICFQKTNLLDNKEYEYVKKFNSLFKIIHFYWFYIRNEN